MSDFPDKFKIAEETDDGIWVYPMLEDGTYSTDKIKLAGKGKQSDPVTFARVAWANANAYLKAATILKDQSALDGHLVLPAAVQAAFACEVYLKSVIYPTAITGDKHNLENLFNQLSPDSLKQEISSKLVSPTTVAEFEQCLSDNSDIFKQLRYVHEQSSMQFNLDFLIWFGSALYQVSKDVLEV